MAKKQMEELSGILSEADLIAFCPDLPNWPTSWCYENRDLIPGEQLVALFKPFLLDLLSQDRTRKTRNLHRVARSFAISMKRQNSGDVPSKT